MQGVLGELGPYEVYANKSKAAQYRGMRAEMTWTMKILERAIWFLFPNHYDRVYDVHVRLPDMRLYPKVHGGTAREVVNG